MFSKQKFYRRALQCALLVMVGAMSMAPRAYAVDSSNAVFGDRTGTIYAIDAKGLLHWYRHDGRLAGSFTWAPGGGTTIGSGWNAMSRVFAGDDGVVYAIDTTGKLYWYRHDGRINGTFNWLGGNVIGSGWGTFTRVFSGGHGVIYAVNTKGQLLWYRHAGYLEGTASWVSGSGKVIGSSGWNNFTQVFSGDEGVIYAIEPGGQLLWYRNLDAVDGAALWDSHSGTQIGTGWNGNREVFSTGDGIVYVIPPSGALTWYRHDAWLTGTFSWTGPSAVGSGWLFP